MLLLGIAVLVLALAGVGGSAGPVFGAAVAAIAAACFVVAVLFSSFAAATTMTS